MRFGASATEPRWQRSPHRRPGCVPRSSSLLCPPLVQERTGAACTLLAQELPPNPNSTHLEAERLCAGRPVRLATCGRNAIRIPRVRSYGHWHMRSRGTRNGCQNEKRTACRRP